MVIGQIRELGVPLKKKGAPGDVNPVLLSFNNWWETFLELRGDSTKSRVSFARCISCGNWSFDDDESYENKLQAIFDLSNSGRATKYTGSSELQPGIEGTRAARPETPAEEKAQVATILSASLTMNRRSIFISDYIVGLALWDARSNDQVCVLPGCKFPVVLRKQGNHYILVGETYVDGYMHGKAMDELKDGKFRLQDFEIH